MIRANTLAVNKCLNLSWADFNKLLHSCWRQSTDLANWCARELDRRDVARMPDMKTLPPMPKIPETKKPKGWCGPRTDGNVLRGLYGMAAVAFRTDTGFWAGAASSVSSICRAVERKHKQERRAIVWDGERRSARYRYPFPFPVHQQSWSCEYRDGKPVIVANLPGGKVEMELRGGPEFARQLADFRRVVNGEATKAQLLISRQRASEGCHRQTTTEKAAGGGAKVNYRITVKLVVDGPERQAAGDRVLTLCTDPEALWVAELDGRRAWLINADHLRRGVAIERDHKRRIQRLGEDRKAEGRRSRPRKRQHKDHLDARADKFANRKKSWVQETVAHLINFCRRQRVAAILYHNEAREYLPLPWMSALGTRLGQVCGAEGICLASRDGFSEKEFACLEQQLTVKEMAKAVQRVLASRGRKKSHPAVSSQGQTSRDSSVG